MVKGLTVYEGEEKAIYENERVTQSKSPNGDVFFDFHFKKTFYSAIRGVEVQYYSFVLNGKEAHDFYANWNSPKQPYVELCKKINQDTSLVPDDIDQEVFE